MSDIIEDKTLIDWFKDNYEKITFINIEPEYERIGRSSRLKESIADLITDKKFFEQKEKLISIWKNLVANAIIFLKSKDDRECFHDDGDYGIEDLGEFFDRYCKFEKLLYGSGEYYRDHVSHVFKVFLLGEKLVRDHLDDFSSIDVMDHKLELCLFRWGEIPGDDNERLLRYLQNEYGIGWVKGAEISKSDDEKTICIKKDENSAKIMFDEIDIKATLELNDGVIYDLKVKIENDERKIIKSKLITAEEKEAMWCIASLTHDLGYPTEVVHKIHDQLKDMLSVFNIKDVSYILSQQSQSFNDFIIRLISSDLTLCGENGSLYYTTHTQAKYYFKYSRSIEKWDHGVESCVVLMKSLVYFLETDFSIDRRRSMKIDDAQQFLIRQRILRSIASHNCDFIYHLKLDLSFLLRIIDEMQEWGRPKLADLFMKTPETGFKIIKFEKDDIEYSITFRYLGGVEPEDIEEFHADVKEYFRRKINTYIMILRSAVDGKQREFVLTFNVVATVSKENTYKFIHKNPQEITCEIDGNSVELPELDENNWDKFYETYLKND
ncbi:MAG: hypothetical protein C4B59_01150 [Candidatus Methanogaster sp.]|uniref:Uncharacterized protein n=1 Tax=Candidatus Methanogaster sp. TaxID=3386292 RepID=A0AC61L693_9EURY|nr:MAG: hypothetical protein C4B59_01150 [ANME-2 cluster archaeon]